MSEGYEEDLAMYEESQSLTHRQLDRESLLKPISEIAYPRNPLSFPPDAKLGEVLERMAEKHIGAEFSGPAGGDKPRGAASDDNNSILLNGLTGHVHKYSFATIYADLKSKPPGRFEKENIVRVNLKELFHVIAQRKFAI